MENLQKEKLEIKIAETELNIKDFVAALPKITYYIILVLLLLTIPVYYFSRFVTKKAALRGLVREEVAAHPAIFTSLPVAIIETSILTMLGQSYSGYALVKNPNKDLVAGNIAYTFTFIDAQENEIASVSDTSYLLAGERKYLIIPQITLARPPAAVRLTIDNPVWKKRLDLPNVLIQQGIPRFGDQANPDGFVIQSEITNQSPYALRTVKINGIVFDKNKNVIAVSSYTMSALKPKETRAYKLFWNIPLAANINSAPQIIIETNILDPDNLQ